MNEKSYQKGRESLLAEDYKAAKREFADTLNSVGEQHQFYNQIISYLGLAQVLTSDRNGLLLCRDAASSEAVEADVYLNLACAEWHADNRQRAVEAINLGRQIDAGHQQLVRASALIDSRRRNALPFLSREHFLNRWLGRMCRKHRNELTVSKLLSLAEFS
jgi:hypothetical protein